MQRKSGFPVANCSIKMPDSINPSMPEPLPCDEDSEQRRLQLINFGHTQWGFNNWSWTVTKQELDFVDPAGNGKYCVGVVAFVSITVKSFDIQRENIGYATSIGNSKGMAIYKSRKCAVTNALRETLLSFGGSVATELTELLETQKNEVANVQNPIPAAAPEPENNQNLANKPAEPKNSPVNKMRKEESTTPANCARPHPPPAIKNQPPPPPPPPVAKAHPMPVSLPPRAPAPPRPNSNELSESSEEEARAERKRRQRLAQEEFRLKQLAKKSTNDDKELSKAGSSIDKLLMDIPTQDIVIEESGVEDGKRKSPADGGIPKRRSSVINRLDIVAD